MRFAPDASCVERRAFRVDLPDGVPLAELARRLVDRFGMHPAPSCPGLITLVDDGGNQLLLVPATGRAQIRVELSIPRLERRWAAERVLVAMARAMGSPE
jgi:hypothetical protein